MVDLFLFIFIHFIRCYRRKILWSIFISTHVFRTPLPFIIPNFSKLASTPSFSLCIFPRKPSCQQSPSSLLSNTQVPIILFFFQSSFNTQIKWHSSVKSSLSTPQNMTSSSLDPASPFSILTLLTTSHLARNVPVTVAVPLAAWECHDGTLCMPLCLCPLYVVR